MCGGWRVDPVQAELGPVAWRADVEDWLRRARRGTGIAGGYDSRTAYFWGERSWGGPLAGACPTPKPAKQEKRPGGKPEKPGEPDRPDKPAGSGDPPEESPTEG
jgi:hypothetical protein